MTLIFAVPRQRLYLPEENSNRLDDGSHQFFEMWIQGGGVSEWQSSHVVVRHMQGKHSAVEQDRRVAGLAASAATKLRKQGDPPADWYSCH